jgi:WD40 repeat protein
VRELQGRKESLHALAFTADNRFLVLGGTACRADVWNLADPTAKRPLYPRLKSTIGDIWVSPDGTEFIVAALTDGSVVRYRFDAPTTGTPFQSKMVAYWMATPRILPDGSGFVCGRVPSRWEFAAGPEPVWQNAQNRTRAQDAITFAVAPDGRTLASCDLTSVTATYLIRTYDMATTDPPREIATVSNLVRRLAWAPDGKHLAAAVDTRVFIWAADGAQVTMFRVAGRKHVADIAFHPSGRRLAVAENSGTVRLLDAATWTEARAFEWGLPKARTVCFSPDGTLAAAGSDTGKVVVWDVDL